MRLGAGSTGTADGCAVLAASVAPVGAKSLSWNVAWTASGSVVYALCQWGTLVAFAKLGTPETLGQFAFALAVTAPIMMFMQLQLRTVQLTDTQGRFRFADYLLVRAGTSIVGLVAILAIVTSTGGSWSVVMVAALVAGVKILDGISDLFYGSWQKRERMDLPAQLLMLNGLVSLVILTLALRAGLSLAAAVAGSMIGSAAAMAASLLFTTGRDDISFLPGPAVLDRLWNLIVVALPLGVVMALVSLSANIPRYFIQSHFGERELGIFTALIYVTSAGMTLMSALGTSLTPRMAREFDCGNHRGFVRLVYGLTGAGTLLGLFSVAAAVVCAEPFLLMAYGPVYSQAAGVFVGAMAMGTVTYMAAAVGFAMSAAKCFRAQAPLLLLVTSTVVAACAVWIPTGGLAGAVWAMLAGAIVQFLGGAAILRRAVRRAASLSHC